MGCFNSKGGGEAGGDVPSDQPKPATNGTAETKGKSPTNAPPPKKNKNEIKLVLLGPGESGKSTIFKQFKIIQDSGFPIDQKRQFIGVIRGTVFAQMRLLVDAAIKSDVAVDGVNLQDILGTLQQASWANDIGQTLFQIWSQPQIKKLYVDQATTLGMADGAAYIFDNLPRITEENYIPSDQDVLRVRIRTAGYDEAVFKYEKMEFRVLDAGGQRAERRHWRNLVEGAQAMIFTASLAEFDQVLREDGKVTRMQETFLLWQELCSSRTTAGLMFILFLNKNDLFREKVQRKSIKVFFKEYTGPDEYEPSLNYIKKKFLEYSGNREVNTHVTCAVDTDSTKLVWMDVRRMIIGKLVNTLL